MRDETWRALDDLFLRFPILKGEGVEIDEINAAEQEVGVPLVEDYKEFVHRYGGAIVGPFKVFGLRKAVPMGKNEKSFIEMTRIYRNQKWPGAETWAIISIDHAGNPIGLDTKGTVWIYDHDARAAQVIAENFEGYLRHQCLNLSD
jgi:hypothetical protein